MFPSLFSTTRIRYPSKSTMVFLNRYLWLSFLPVPLCNKFCVLLLGKTAGISEEGIHIYDAWTKTLHQQLHLKIPAVFFVNEIKNFCQEARNWSYFKKSEGILKIMCMDSTCSLFLWKALIHKSFSAVCIWRSWNDKSDNLRKCKLEKSATILHWN